MLDAQTCWTAVANRDGSQDGKFYFGVITTGVYCRPSCPARRPLRKNVRFYATPEAAERDGLRPCLRCRPLATQAEGPQSARIRVLCSYIRRNADSGTPLSLKDLSRKAGLSPFHLLRSFKASTGLTPRQYLEACRMDSFKDQLRTGASVTEAIYGAGFGSSSRVYERADTRLGMTPAEYRAGGKGVCISFATAESPVGLMMVAATDRGLCFVQFGESRRELLEKLREEYPAAVIDEMPQPHPEQFRRWMDALSRRLSGDPSQLDLPMDIRATTFQWKVWRYLQSIPYGEVRTYSEVAAAVGTPKRRAP